MLDKLTYGHSVSKNCGVVALSPLLMCMGVDIHRIP